MSDADAYAATPEEEGAQDQKTSNSEKTSILDPHLLWKQRKRDLAIRVIAANMADMMMFHTHEERLEHAALLLDQRQQHALETEHVCGSVLIELEKMGLLKE